MSQQKVDRSFDLPAMIGGRERWQHQISSERVFTHLVRCIELAQQICGVKLGPIRTDPENGSGGRRRRRRRRGWWRGRSASVVAPRAGRESLRLALVLRPHRRTEQPENGLHKSHLSFSAFLCLSQACLGKKIVVSIQKLLTKAFFRTELTVCTAFPQLSAPGGDVALLCAR